MLAPLLALEEFASIFSSAFAIDGMGLALNKALVMGEFGGEGLLHYSDCKVIHVYHFVFFPPIFGLHNEDVCM